MKWQVVSVVLHVVTLGLLAASHFSNVGLTRFVDRNDREQLDIHAVASHAYANFVKDQLSQRIGDLESLKDSPVYIDESEIPPLLRDVEMGAAYPHIVIDGEKLDYHADRGYYCYAGSKDRAMWLGFGKERELIVLDKGQ